MQVSLIDATPGSPTEGQQLAIPGGPFTIQMNVGSGKLALNNVGGATLNKQYVLVVTGDAI